MEDSASDSEVMVIKEDSAIKCKLSSIRPSGGIRLMEEFCQYVVGKWFEQLISLWDLMLASFTAS